MARLNRRLKWNSLMPACSASRARLNSSAMCSAIQSVIRRSLKPGSDDVSPRNGFSERHVVSREMDGDRLSDAANEQAAGRRPHRLLSQFLQERNEVRIFEAGDVPKASVLGVCTKHVLQRLVEKRQAEKNEDDLKRLRGQCSPPEIVRRARSREEQRTLFQATRDPGPLFSRSCASASPEVIQTMKGSVTAGMVKTSATGGSEKTES